MSMADYLYLDDDRRREIARDAIEESLRQALGAVRGWTEYADDADVLASCRHAVTVADMLAEITEETK